MAGPEFTLDDEIAHSLRTIQQQRSTKRFFMLGGLAIALVALMLAALLAYSDTLEGKLPVPASIGGR